MGEMHVLMVEDSNTHARILQRFLDDRGAVDHFGSFRVTRAKSLAEATRLLEAFDDLDVISLDLTLPDSQGLATYEAMALAAPDIPIVVMTGLDDDAIAFEALAAGAQDYVVKSRSSSLGFARTLSFAIERHRLTTKLHDAIEERDRKGQQLRDFVGMASHELLNPMNAVHGLASTLSGGWERMQDDQRRDFAGRIARQTSVAVRVSSQFLDWARSNDGEIEVTPVAVPIADAVATASELAGVPVTTAGDVDASLLVDRGHLDSILGNLLGNARKYGEPPYEVVVLDLGGVVEVEVRDHGPGVPSDQVEGLFDRYDRAGRDDDLGHGVGLHLVRTLARANGGDVLYGEGTTGGASFTVRLPAARDLTPAG